MSLGLFLLIFFLFQIANTFIVITQTANWTEAEDYCIQTYNSHLASIHSLSENTEVFDLIVVASWIGLNDIEIEGTWIWTDGSTNTFTHWYPNEPSQTSTGGYPEHCGLIYPLNHHNGRDSYWNDGGCSAMLTQFVCNDPIPTTEPSQNIGSSTTQFMKPTTCTTTSLAGYGLSKVSHLFMLSENKWGSRLNMTMGDGNTYDSFIVIHPIENKYTSNGYGYAEWQLNGQYVELTGVIGYSANDLQMKVNQIQMRIYVDGYLEHESQIFTSLTQFEYINVNVSGGNVLQIGADALGSQHCDHAVIANPQLLGCALTTELSTTKSSQNTAVSATESSQNTEVSETAPSTTELSTSKSSQNTAVLATEPSQNTEVSETEPSTTELSTSKSSQNTAVSTTKSSRNTEVSETEQSTTEPSATELSTTKSSQNTAVSTTKSSQDAEVSETEPFQNTDAEQGDIDSTLVNYQHVSEGNKLSANMSDGYVLIILSSITVCICFVCIVVYICRSKKKQMEPNDQQKEMEVDEFQMNDEINNNEGNDTIEGGRKIVVHSQSNQLEFDVIKHLHDLDDTTFSNLISTIKTYFNLTNDYMISLYEMENGTRISIDDVNDIVDAFEAKNHDNNLMIHLHVETEENRNIQIEIANEVTLV